MSSLFAKISLIIAIIVSFFITGDVAAVTGVAEVKELTTAEGKTVKRISFEVVNETGEFISKPVPVKLEMKIGDAWVDTKADFLVTEEALRVNPTATYSANLEFASTVLLLKGDYRLTVEYTMLDSTLVDGSAYIEFTLSEVFYA